MGFYGYSYRKGMGQRGITMGKSKFCIYLTDEEIESLILARKRLIELVKPRNPYMDDEDSNIWDTIIPIVDVIIDEVEEENNGST